MMGFVSTKIGQYQNWTVPKWSNDNIARGTYWPGIIAQLCHRVHSTPNDHIFNRKKVINIGIGFKCGTVTIPVTVTLRDGDNNTTHCWWRWQCLKGRTAANTNRSSNRQGARARINCAWGEHLTCQLLGYLFVQNIFTGQANISCKPYFLCNLVLIFKFLYKCNAEEYSIEIVLGLIDKHIQGILLGHLHQRLRWNHAEQEESYECGTSWAITFVSAECDFVSICNVSSFRPFLQNKCHCSKLSQGGRYCQKYKYRGWRYFLTKMEVLCSPSVSPVSRCPT